MKTIYSTFALILIFSQCFTQTGKIDANNINVTVTPTGVQFQTDSGAFPQYFETTPGSNQSTFFSTSTWMTGHDSTNQLYGSYQLFITDSTSMATSTGPLSVTAGSGGGTKKDFGAATISAVEKAKWNKVFCVERYEIDLFLRWFNSPSSFPGYNIPSSIIDWPAHGDPQIGQDFYLAPFYDNPNGPAGADGLYNPMDGDYPCIKGDQYCWYILNDRTISNTNYTIGIETHVEVYSFDKDSLNPLSNTIFVGKDIINRSTNTLFNFSVGQMSDLDIGCAADDYIGSMPNLNSYYGYNADAVDNNCNGGKIPYGINSPAQGVTFLNQSMNSSMYFNNETGLLSTPSNLVEANRALNGMWKDGSQLYYGGNGYPGSIGASTSTTNHPFPYIAPTGSLIWTEHSAGTPSGDRRMLGSTAPITLSPGQVVELDIAYVFSRNDSGNISSVDKLYRDIQTVQAFYNDSIPNINSCQAFVLSVPEETKIKASIYPNPTTNAFTIETEGTNAIAEVVSIDGKLIVSGLQLNQSTKIDATDWEDGLYLVKITNEEGDFIVLRIVKN